MQLHMLEPLFKIFCMLTKISWEKLQTNINLYLKQESGEI